MTDCSGKQVQSSQQSVACLVAKNSYFMKAKHTPLNFSHSSDTVTFVMIIIYSSALVVKCMLPFVHSLSLKALYYSTVTFRQRFCSSFDWI